MATEPLRHLYVYLTGGCNQACRHCWLAPRRARSGREARPLPVDVLARALEEAVPLGLEEVKLTGGEPLLHPEIKAVLGLVAARGLRLLVETNGTLLTPALADLITSNPRATVSVSLESSEASVHDFLRGDEGAFRRTCRAVRRLVERGRPPQLIMTLQRENVGQVEGVIELAERLGADSLKFNLLQPTARGERLHRSGHALPVADLVALGRRVESELAPRTGVQLVFDHPAAFRSLARMARGQGCGSCGILGTMGLLHDGTWALCGIGGQVKELVFGKVGGEPLATLWERHPVLTALRRGLPGRLRGVCRRCLMQAQCLGACVAQNFYRTGSLWGAHWFCQAAQDEGLFPASRLRPGGRDFGVLRLGDGAAYRFFGDAAVLGRLRAVAGLRRSTEQAVRVDVRVRERGKDGGGRRPWGYPEVFGHEVTLTRPRAEREHDFLAWLLSLVVAQWATTRGGVLLHGALVARGGRSVLLAGPSGVGKTTASARVARPWRALADDSTLVVRGGDGRYLAHPWPTWSRVVMEGSPERWKTSEAVELAAVAFLSQGPRDQVAKLDRARALGNLVEVAEQACVVLTQRASAEQARAQRLARFAAVGALALAVPAYSLALGLAGPLGEVLEPLLEERGSSCARRGRSL